MQSAPENGQTCPLLWQDMARLRARRQKHNRASLGKFLRFGTPCCDRTHILCRFALAIAETSRHLALQHKSGNARIMRNSVTHQPISSAAVLPDVRVLGSVLLLVLVIILTSITGAVSAPAS